MVVNVGDDVEIDDSVMASAFLNSKGGVSVIQETYDGKSRAVIDTYVPSKDAGVFAKGHTPRVLTRSQKDAAPAQDTPEQAQVVVEDDIPF